MQFAHMLTGKIGHVHFIDSDETLHDAHTSTHAPFGQGVLDFDEIVQAIVEAGYTDDWWPIDLCFWPNALEATAPAKKFMDELVARHSEGNRQASNVRGGTEDDGDDEGAGLL